MRQASKDVNEPRRRIDVVELRRFESIFFSKWLIACGGEEVGAFLRGELREKSADPAGLLRQQAV
jgi:hypothetical protein